jgi:hypothetical protein
LVPEAVLLEVLAIARKIVREQVSPYEGAAAIWAVLAEQEGD